MAKKGKASRFKKLEKKVLLDKGYIWEGISKAEEAKVMAMAEEYKTFLDVGKTERECAENIVALAEKQGYVPLTGASTMKPGDKYHIMPFGKTVFLVLVGKRPMEEGFNIIGSHIDSPRLDLKPQPLYEDKTCNMALFRTHYYGGIKKYNWASTELAIHARVINQEGKTVDIVIGEDPNDPLFTIPDLLPHLYRESQALRKAPQVIKGEELRVLVGNRGVDDKDIKNKVKLWILDYLHTRYGIVEEDFITSEFEIVPAGKARDIGLDRSMIGAYGQDDRICAFTSMKALFDLKKPPNRTSIIMFFDKEEIGSTGATGADSLLLQNVIAHLFEVRDGEMKYREASVRKALVNSYAISADVTAGINPIFKDVHEHDNASRLAKGIAVTKYTGSGGKYGASDASPEFVGKMRNILNKKKIPWQTGELGKVDEGGGGTIAKHMAFFGIHVLDAGPPLLSMHTPLEVSSKVDIKSSMDAYRAFLTDL